MESQHQASQEHNTPPVGQANPLGFRCAFIPATIRVQREFTRRPPHEPFFLSAEAPRPAAKEPAEQALSRGARLYGFFLGASAEGEKFLLGKQKKEARPAGRDKQYCSDEWRVIPHHAAWSVSIGKATTPPVGQANLLDSRFRGNDGFDDGFDRSHAGAWERSSKKRRHCEPRSGAAIQFGCPAIPGRSWFDTLPRILSLSKGTNG